MASPASPPPRGSSLWRDDASGQRKIYRLDYDGLVDGDSTPGIVLRSGDVIIVPQRHLFE